MELKKEEIIVGATITLSKSDFDNIKQACRNINDKSIATEFRLKHAMALADMFGFRADCPMDKTAISQPAALYDVYIRAVKNGAEIVFGVGREWRNLSEQQKEIVRNVLGPWCELKISKH